MNNIATTLRTLSIDQVEAANSGHPGLPLGAADFCSVLWSKFLRFNPKDPNWLNRDRFILSAGHGSALLYSLLHLFGYNLSLDELKRFRQWESKTPGHPEFGMTEGVEATTGPLGQGTANAVGMALSQKLLAARYGEDLFNYRTFALVSDGDLMEGISSEAASLAGHLGLNNLIYLYDDNKISLADPTDVCFSEDVSKRFESQGWFAQTCDGHDHVAIEAALSRALNEKNKPSIICFRTTIGFGSPNKSNTSDVHGSPLGSDEAKKTKISLGVDPEKTFFIPDEVKAEVEQILKSKEADYKAWNLKFESSPHKNSILGQLEKTIPDQLSSELLALFSDGKTDATRNLSGKAIQVIAKHLPWFIGGSADLEPSTKTLIKDTSDVSKSSFSGKNIRFGVREHAMGAIANGLSYTKMWTPFTATFLVFSDYMRPTIRLAALSHLQTVFIFTHDSFWVGEDGPTHEPIEQTQSLRLIPNLNVWRPADGVETAMSYVAALSRKDGPSALLFTRQSVPALKRQDGFKPEDVLKGGYIVSGDDADVVLLATGSEVSLAVSAKEILSDLKIRVVSMPCVEAFLAQDKAYQESVLPAKATKISIEAGVTWGWEKLTGGNCIGVDHYGASAPGGEIAKKFGFTPEAIAERVRAFLK